MIEVKESVFHKAYKVWRKKVGIEDHNLVQGDMLNFIADRFPLINHIWYNRKSKTIGMRY